VWICGLTAMSSLVVRNNTVGDAFQIEALDSRIACIGCPLYPYRPTSRISPGNPEALPHEIESKNSEQMVFSYG
jgi:hypothetical protein